MKHAELAARNSPGGYGGLLLRGATAAARQRRAGAATDLLAEVTTAARRTGADRSDHDVVFGPGHVVMGAVDCSVVAEVAHTMPRNAALPLSTRSRHPADVAHAQLRWVMIRLRRRCC
jgi:hypothetical protein